MSGETVESKAQRVARMVAEMATLEGVSALVIAEETDATGRRWNAISWHGPKRDRIVLAARLFGRERAEHERDISDEVQAGRESAR